MRNVEVKAKWWVFSQNNSGGYFIQNDDVDHYVAIQALNVEHALSRAERIFACYSEYCGCCGERWDYWAEEDEGTEIPEIYGEIYTEKKPSSYREYIVLHYMDDAKEKYKFGEGVIREL